MFIVACSWPKTAHDFQCVVDEDERLQTATRLTMSVFGEGRKRSSTTVSGQWKLLVIPDAHTELQ